jgi:hypothetical protein
VSAGPPPWPQVHLDAGRIGQAVCDRGTRRLRRLARRADRTAGRLAETGGRRRRAEQSTLRDPALGWRAFGTIDGEAEALDSLIVTETAAGSLRHRRLPWLLRRVPAAVAVADLVVLCSYTAEVFDVDPEHPASLPGLIALVFAVLACGTSYAWLSLTGHRLRSFRDRRGEICWSVLGATTWVTLALTVVLLAVLGALMAVRVHEEILLFDPTSASATPVAAVFAVLGVVANCSVVAVHALDGSDQTHRLAELRRLARRREARLAGHDRRLGRLRHRLARLARRASRHRTALQVRTTERGTVALDWRAADEALDHVAAPPVDDPADPPQLSVVAG